MMNLLGRPLSRVKTVAPKLRGRAAHLASLTAKDYDVVIAGGGAMGSSVAYHLAVAKPSLKVLCVEQVWHSSSVNHANLGKLSAQLIDSICYQDPRFVNCSAMLSAGGIRQQFSLKVNIELSMYGIEFLRRASVDLAVKGCDPPDGSDRMFL